MPHKTDVNAGLRLRERRLAKGMTQTQLGEAVGLSFQQVQKYEKGTNRMGASRLQQFASILGCDVSDFFDTPECTAEGQKLDRRALQIAAEMNRLSPEMQQNVLNIVRSLPNA